MTKFFKKFQKPYFEPYSESFCPNLGQKWIFLEKGLCQFFNIRITYYCAKNQKDLINYSWENCWRDTPKTSLFHWFLCELQPILESCDWLKNPAICLAKSILGHISSTRIFPNMKFVQAYKNYSNINFHYKPNW